MVKLFEPIFCTLYKLKPPWVYLPFQRDAALEEKVMRWITGILQVEPTTDYEHFIRDGSVLSK